MQKPYVIIGGITLLVALGVFALTFSTQIPDQHATPATEAINNRTFSNTQTWGEVYLAAANSNEPFLAKALSVVSIPPPALNNSTTTHSELSYLKELQKNRTEEQIAEIEREMDINTTFFGSTTILELLSREERPYSNALLHMTLEKSGTVIHSLKRTYDRVRPSYLDSDLQPAIEVPSHPAYPSGHATQTRILALLFAELDPQHADHYFDASTRIAHNREIAGVHYPSDSKAGQDLAIQLFPLLMEDPAFRELYILAQGEW